MKQTVISYYNNDLSWTKELSSDIIVYDKSQNLDTNVYPWIKDIVKIPNEFVSGKQGREPFTYIYHMEEQRETLKKYSHISFLQDDTPHHAHSNKYIEVINSNNKEQFTWLGSIMLGEDQEGRPNLVIPMPQMYKEMFGNDINFPNWSFCHGAIFEVSTDLILNRPKGFFWRCWNIATKYWDDTYGQEQTNIPTAIFERAWNHIFTDEINKNILMELQND